jgi:hypothetical protein
MWDYAFCPIYVIHEFYSKFALGIRGISSQQLIIYEVAISIHIPNHSFYQAALEHIPP